VRGSHWDSWDWDQNGIPRDRRYISTTSSTWSADESYTVDGAGRVISSLIARQGPPGWPEAPDQHATYQYDTAGHVIERIVDGKSDFHARYDDAGRLIELGL